ncbi:MAG: LysM peptidoglycan-binding domain-containing protein [Clostridia bacterium]|nr:LysM peptidoglycan-binding domain-containing protein [Clostridia bacterium]
MKSIKMVVAALLFAVVSTLGIGAAFADMDGSTGIFVNNQPVSSNVSNSIEAGVVMTPAKELITALGGSFSYQSTNFTATVRLGENELVFRLDNSIVKWNGKYVQAPAPLKIINYRLMLPAAFAVQKLGAESYMNLSKNMLMIFQPVNGKLVYQVMPGDSLWIISRLFSTSITSIKTMNGLTTDMLYIGQKLQIKEMIPDKIAWPAQVTGSATLRSGPGFNYSPLGYIQAWSNITVTGKNGDWYSVMTSKGNGYIYYSLVSVKQELTDTAQNSRFFYNSIPVDTSKNTVTYNSYTVQKGDNIWNLSQRYGIPDFELAQANNRTSTTMLYPGQVIKIPVHYIAPKVKLNDKSGELLDWFKEAQYIITTGKTGKFIDMETGKSFMAKRTMGASHADVETLTLQDTQTMKEIFGGWFWKTRAFILEVDGRRFAVSVSGMPHAGIDGVPYLQNVDNRSGNYGYGPNYDSIAGNGMDGHFDVYTLNGLRHKDGKIDHTHQYSVLTAGGFE